MNQEKIEFANQNNIEYSNAKLAGLGFERHCWSMLCEVAKVVNLANADIVEVRGNGAGSHIALLARQFPTLSFALVGENGENDASRVLWLSSQCEAFQCVDNMHEYDAIVVCHPPEYARMMINQFDGFARIAAKREIGENTAISIFGRGLRRDLFKPKVRGELAA